MKHLRNIRRIDNETNRTYAWLVQVQRRNRIAIKMFTDTVFGGKRQALQSAIAYREQCIAQTDAAKHNLWLRTRLRRNNTSGIPGVSRHDNVSNPRTGARREFWLASWIDQHGVSRKRKFSVLRYGEAGAKRRAIEERRRRLKEVCLAKGG